MSAPRRNRPTPRGSALSDDRRTRRDPRVEREHPEPMVLTETVSRVRRDPRALRVVGLLAPHERLRIDRSQPMTLVDAAAKVKARDITGALPAVIPVVIEDPSCWILAIPDVPDGRLSPHDRDALGAARGLADSCGGAVVALVFEPVEALGAAGADRVMRFDYVVKGYAPEMRAAAVLAAIESLKPRHVVFPDSPTGGGDLGRRVAGRLGEWPATHVRRSEEGAIVSRGDGGHSDFLHDAPRFVLVDPGAGGTFSEALREGRVLDAPLVAVDPRITDLGMLPVESDAVPLAEAEFIVSGGAGIRNWDSFHILAGALGASEGGSRVVCDAGSLPRERQIGASGTLVAPRCYLALGISGAPQHLQGIARAESVIAVNTDPHAEIMKRADLAIVGDAQAIMDTLLRLLAEVRDVA
ncbi:MAG: electron transfer flavoprotein subunit alpha/FixB family protein [Gammaproteobacteria bacterium]